MSIGIDPLPNLISAAREWDITTSLLSDGDSRVSQAYGVLQWAMGVEPGHTFVLVGRDGRIKWVKDYGAPQNGGLMYVPVNELYRWISVALR